MSCGIVNIRSGIVPKYETLHRVPAAETYSPYTEEPGVAVAVAVAGIYSVSAFQRFRGRVSELLHECFIDVYLFLCIYLSNVYAVKLTVWITGFFGLLHGPLF